MTTGGDTGSPGPGDGGPHRERPDGRDEPDGPRGSAGRTHRNEDPDEPDGRNGGTATPEDRNGGAEGRNGAEPPDRPKRPARPGHGRNGPDGPGPPGPSGSEGRDRSDQSSEAGDPDRPGSPGHPANPARIPRLPMLLDAVLNVGSEVELASTLQHVVDSAADLTEARYGALALAGPAHGRGRSRIAELFSVGLSEDERRRITRLPTGHTGLLGHPGSTLSLGVPVRVNNDVLGYLCLARKRHGPFTEEDLALLRVLASQAGIAIGNARLYGTARQRERWIEGAAAVTTALLTGESAEDALTTLAKAARILAGAAAGVVLQPTDEGGMEIVAASALDDPGDIVGTSIAPGSPVLVQLLGGEPVYIDDSSTDPRMTTHVRSRFGPSMMLPLQSGGRLIGTLALPRKRGGRPYTPVDRMLATQFASQAALALVLADAQHNRERLAVFEDRDRIARDLHDLVVQRLFATEMMLESTRRRTGEGELADLLGHAVDELDSTIQEVRTTIFALQQPPADAPTGLRGKVLRETAGAAVLLGFQPSVHFTGAVDTLVRDELHTGLLAALRGALAAAHRRAGVTSIEVEVDATARLPGDRDGVRLVVSDDGDGDGSDGGSAVVWEAEL